MSKELTPLEALAKLKQNDIDDTRLFNYQLYDIIEPALESYEQIKKCHLIAIPRMSNKTSIVDELMYLQEVIRVMTTILHYSYTNRFIVKQAFDEGWINEAQYQLMIETFGYYNCTGKEEPNEDKRNIS